MSEHIDGSAGRRGEETDNAARSTIDGLADLGGSNTVLLVDSAAGLRDVVRQWLRTDDRAWQVREAAYGTQGVFEIDDTVDALVLEPQVVDAEVEAFLDEAADTGFDGPTLLFTTRTYRPDEHAVVDGHLRKPVSRERFLGVLSDLVAD